ncbi:uncharacterized protein LOC118737156 isoform X2 [Rhagoletis pomonella]|uniref:uncharacterized protein LOC118737156 isoform X2 n=1 Tax=Rhagoletis pomonella TaxID=28610 RepID=UPI00177EAB6C|nr:uncharacterized protein LOC118737156 isoform X2 [Rhagoletis pomonella]
MKLILLLSLCLVIVVLFLAATPQANAAPATDTEEEENVSEDSLPERPRPDVEPLRPFRPFLPFRPFPFNPFNFTGNPFRPLPFIFPPRNLTGRPFLNFSNSFKSDVNSTQSQPTKCKNHFFPVIPDDFDDDDSAPVKDEDVKERLNREPRGLD